MLEIDLVINVIKNGKWHDLDEIIEKCKLPEVKVQNILRFLAEYDFIEINGVGQKVRVDSSLQKLLEETQL